LFLTLALLLLLQFSRPANAALIVTNELSTITMPEGSVMGVQMTVMNTGVLAVQINGNEALLGTTLGDPTDSPSDFFPSQSGFPVIAPNASFVFMYNVVSSFEDAPFENDSGFTPLVVFINGIDANAVTYFVQGIGGVTIQDVPMPPTPEPSTLALSLIAGLGVFLLMHFKRLRIH